MIARLRLFAFWMYLPTLTVLSLIPLQFPVGVARGDLYLHAMAYVIMAQLAPWPFDGRGMARFAAFAFTYGIGIELTQHFITILNRNGDWTDVAANATGIAMGIGLRMLVDRVLARSTRGV